MTISFGLKLWSSNSDIIEEASLLVRDGYFQYIELTPVPSTDIQMFQSFDVPYVIHVTSERWGMNISDPNRSSLNNELLDLSVKWADALGAKDMILHPGFGDIKNTIEFLNDIQDERIIIENMPKVGLGGETMVGFTPEQIKQLCGERFGFCLDINHAVKAASALGKPYDIFIKHLLDYQPRIFHIADGSHDIHYDEHLAIGAGSYDFKSLFDPIYQIDAIRLTLETPRSSLDDDINNLRKFQTIIRGLQE